MKLNGIVQTGNAFVIGAGRYQMMVRVQFVNTQFAGHNGAETIGTHHHFGSDVPQPAVLLDPHAPDKSILQDQVFYRGILQGVHFLFSSLKQHVVKINAAGNKPVHVAFFAIGLKINFNGTFVGGRKNNAVHHGVRLLKHRIQ